MQFTIIFFSIFVCQTLFSQIQVVDLETSKPIPFVYFRYDGMKQGIISDVDGKLDLNSLIVDSDSIEISCVGYKTEVFSINELTKKAKVILSPTYQDISEVKISHKKGKYSVQKLGITKKPKTLFFDYSVTAENGTINAVFIQNDKSKPCFLKSVNIFVTKNGFPDAYFRVRVYGVSPFQIKPDHELTTSNLIATGGFGDDWIQIDLSKERIMVPENGCFIGIEWFDHPKASFFADTLKIKGVHYSAGKTLDTVYTHVRSGNGIVVGSRSESYKNAKNKIWYKTQLSTDWINQSLTDEEKFNLPDTLGNGHVFHFNENNLFFKIPCINIEVSYPIEKVSIGYDDPKKRKLNKIERVKENTFKYPQSTVSELFSSLLMAVENDDVIYILKFLCVYKDDELDEILTNLTEKSTESNEYFSKQEKQSIKEQFQIILSSLNAQSLKKIENHHFELNVNSIKYNLIVENGKWKINPYSYQIISVH